MATKDVEKDEKRSIKEIFMGVCGFIVDSGGGERKIDSDCDHKEINRFGIHKAGLRNLTSRTRM